MSKPNANSSPRANQNPSQPPSRPPAQDRSQDRRRTFALAAACLGLTALLPIAVQQAVAQDEAPFAVAHDDALTAARDQRPPVAGADAQRVIRGTIVSSGVDSFRLDSGDGILTVEMASFEFYRQGRQLRDDDQVVVYGKVGDGLGDQQRIRAGSVYVENLDAHLYANESRADDQSD